MAGIEPVPDFSAGSVRGIGTGEPARDEAKLRRLCSYCFLKALARMHAAALHPRLQFS
jgi:hypothetical protein